ncbi:HET-domain-containing protein [Hypoxylon sp. FL1284]|nr:HET-domain-containing protein [Hypoxylon sp. FL1284]
MWCFASCFASGKSRTRLVKRRRKFEQTRNEVEFDGDSDQFSYATIPLYVQQLDQRHDFTNDKIPDSKACHRTIRLLRILPTRSDGLLRCSIRAAELDNLTVQYDALSYTWERTSHDNENENQNHAEKQCVTVCNGRQLCVKQNLFDCLSQLEASEYYGRDIWIDAICINQSDESERSQQVEIMAEIYRSAKRVIIWLGSADSFTRPAWELIRALSCLSDDDLTRIKPHENENKHNIRVLGHTNSPKNWMALGLLFERRWFGRAWVVQELVLAQSTTVLCGRYVFDWESIAKVSHFMSKRIPMNMANSLLYKGPTKLAAIKKGVRAGTGNILLYSLIRCRTYDATLHKDKVYSLLGLAKLAGEDYPDYLKCDYKRDVAGIYTDIARYIIESSDDLHILAHAEGDEFRERPGLPTWVPDWSVRKDVGLRITGYKRYLAAGTLPRLAIQDGNTLTVRGFELDTITRVGETKEEVNQHRSCPGWFAILEELEQKYPERDYKDAFWRTLLLDTDPSETVPITQPWDNSFAVWLKMHEHGLSEDEMQRAAEFETSFTHSLNLRIFRTSRGHLGCGSLSCKEGDRVWIIQGSRVPLMLRPAGKGGSDVYSLVGGTYLHGFMQGEALLGDPEFSDVTLV